MSIELERAQPRGKILIVDDSPEMAEMVADGLKDRGFDALPVASSRDAAERLRTEPFSAVVTDLRMPEVDGLGLLALARKLDPARPVIVMTAFGAIDSAVESIQQGAYHYLTKPFKIEELAIFLGRALEERSVRQEAAALKTALKERFAPSSVVGQGAAMRRVLDVLERVAATDAPVLLHGETGTGKGLIAKILHAESKRAERPFVSINCAALPENLLESELFGHVKGSFTGATADRAGLFAEADGGTIFLDEIAELPLSLQAKLLHVLEANVVRPVGSNKERKVDARIVAATHRNLRDLARDGKFREDLLYRLDVVPIELPPLRQRREDLPELVAHFLGEARRKHPSSNVRRFSRAALEALLLHEWPGNVRELSHVIERVVLLGRSEEVPLEDLPATVTSKSQPQPVSFGSEVMPLRELQKRYAAWALDKCGGHRGQTAEKLDIDGKTLAKYLSEG